MKQLFILFMSLIFVICLAGCNDKKSFNVIEKNISSINHSDEYLQTLDGEGLIIIKNSNQLHGDINNKGIYINIESIYDEYDDEFFENKYLVVFFNTDSRSGIKYNFKSITTDNDELILNLEMTAVGEGMTVEVERLFFIEIDKDIVEQFDIIKCKIKKITR